MEPESRVSLVVSAQQRDAQVDRGQTHASDCIRRQRAAVEIASLDQQVRERGSSAELGELSPEMALDYRGVKIEYLFSLHDCVVADGVVARSQRRELDLGAQVLEESRDAALLLVDIDDDANRRAG